MSEQSERSVATTPRAEQNGLIYIYWAACKSCGYTTAVHGRAGCPDCGETMAPYAIAGAVVDDEPRSVDTVECAVCGSDLSDPKNAGDPDVDGNWVCRSKSCRAAHDTEMTVNLGELFG